MIGESGFKRELEKAGITVEVIADESETFLDDEYINFKPDPNVKAVVVGIDFKFSYRKLSIASLYIQFGAQFICSNKDRNSGSGDRLPPGAGAIVKAIETASGKQAIVMGKPSTFAYELICKEH